MAIGTFGFCVPVFLFSSVTHFSDSQKAKTVSLSQSLDPQSRCCTFRHFRENFNE